MKNKLKKLIAGIMAITLMLSMAACTDKKTADNTAEHDEEAEREIIGQMPETYLTLANDENDVGSVGVNALALIEVIDLDTACMMLDMEVPEWLLYYNITFVSYNKDHQILFVQIEYLHTKINLYISREQLISLKLIGEGGYELKEYKVNEYYYYFEIIQPNRYFLSIVDLIVTSVKTENLS